MPDPARAIDAETVALKQGRAEGLALAALVLGVAAFLNLLGVEKGVLAIVFGVLAVRGLGAGAARRQGWIAIALGVVQIATIAIVLVLFHDKLGQLIELLKTLG